MQNLLIDILTLIASFLAVAIVLTLHEFSHAFVAYKCGDPTPKFAGRLTLNPLAHFDILGLVMFTLAGFGWAKPVPINAYNFRHYRRGLALTALAGVVINYISVLFFYPLNFIPVHTPWWALDLFIRYFFLFLYSYSLAFCVFNLIPLPPLDGWKVVEATNKRRGKIFRFFQRYGNIFLLVMIGIHLLVEITARYPSLAIASRIFSYVDILGYIMTYVTYYLGWPIFRLWEVILNA